MRSAAEIRNAILTGVTRSFDDLVAEADAADVSGWDFSWLGGRATEQRPPWGYQRQLGERLSRVEAALDVQTGGGEVLAGATSRFPRTMVATESWPANLAIATHRLHPLGVVVVSDPDDPPLPFAEGAFDLVSSRHPASVWWDEIARVLRPGGTYFAQHVGPRSNAELYEFFLGPQPGPDGRSPEEESAAATAAGLDVGEPRTERLRVEFRDVGAVVYFLRKVIWTVPDFTVARYRGRLLELHRLIEAEGPFVSHSSRTLFEAVKPA
jgi:SAM-dependent methyltransferase